MSTLDLADLEAARDELADAVMRVLALAVSDPNAKDNATEALYPLGSVAGTIERAIEACGEPAEEGA